MFSSNRARVPGGNALFLLCAAVVLGCGQGPGGGPAGGEPKPEATLSAADLYKDLDKYQGKWVVVIARIPQVHENRYPDRVEGTVDLLGDDGKIDSSADFDAEQWAKKPKFEDGVRYEILGQVAGSKQYGGKLKHARVLGTAQGSGPAVEATVSAKDLVADPAKYKGKLIQVNGEVKSGNPAKPNATLTLAGTDTKSVICLCAPGEFDKALKAGRGAQVEIKGLVADAAGGFTTMNDCAVVKATPAGPPLRAANFTREFAQDAAKAEQKYKDKAVTVTGKVEAVGDGKIVLTGFTDPKKKLMSQKITANFGPDWKEALAKVKAGDEATVSGDFDSYHEGDAALSGCWLLPK
jgi:hypothetical protein